MTTGYYEIVNWEKYQHYKDRNPPWIKLYNDTLASRAWIMGDNDSRVLMIASMIIASRTGNKIPDDPEYIKRVANLPRKPNFRHLLDFEFIRFIGDDSNSLATDTQDATQRRVETEKRQRKEETEADALAFDVFWEEYPKKVGKGAARRAFEKIKPSPDLLTEMLTAIKQQKKQKQWQERQYIPNPATWLNQERWSDSVEVGVAPPPESTGPKKGDRRDFTDTNGDYVVMEWQGKFGWQEIERTSP